jgi:transcriptional regulator with XRE-family HTH domain
MDNEKNRLKTSLGNNLRKIRTGQCLTQKQLAEAIGISTSYYTNIENGRQRPSVYTLYRISRYLQVSMDSLLNDGPDDTSISDIEAFLRNQPTSLISKCERILRVILED